MPPVDSVPNEQVSPEAQRAAEPKTRARSLPSFPLDGLRRHKLITVDLARKLPPIRSQAGKGMDAVALVKLFAMMSGRLTFYVTEFDGADELYGYMLSPLGDRYDEWGYQSLAGLAELSRGGVPSIERDKFFRPATVAECLKAGL